MLDVPRGGRDVGCSARRPGCWMFRAAAGMLDVGCWMLDVGCWMLDVGCWMLDVGCWMLDVGCWMLERCADDISTTTFLLSYFPTFLLSYFPTFLLSAKRSQQPKPTLKIHPSALIDPAAELGTDVSVGPFAVIEAGVKIGGGSTIRGHAQVLTGVTLGEQCEVGHASIIGGAPQDLGFDVDTPSGVMVGAKTVFREHVTVSRSSVENGNTIIGESNFFMAATHAGHDCIVGDRNVLANNVALAGHVHLGSDSFLGGGAGFHQFLRIGDRCMVKGLGRMSQDIPPYVIAGECNEVMGLNVIGLRRAGFSAATRSNLKEAYKLILVDGLLLKEALAAAADREWEAPAQLFLDFFRGETKKGICR